MAQLALKITMTALCALALCGCSSYGTKVFVHQNQVSQRIGFDILEAEGKKDERRIAALDALEDELNAECDSVKEAGTRKMNGGELSAWEKLLMFMSLPDCEATTKRVEILLPKS